MAFVTHRMGGGMQLKAAADAIPDNGLRVCRYCAFDAVGTVTSARGRVAASDADGNGTGTAIGSSGSLLRGFDGSISSTRYRYLKRGAGVFTGSVTDTTNLTAEYTTSFGTLPNPVKGLTAPTGSSTSSLSGFTYNGYAYAADGTTLTRYKHGTGAQTWGLVSPGYHELTGSKANPLSMDTGSDDDLVTVTVVGGHGLGLGIADSPSYPYSMNIELVGLKTLGGIPDNEINCLHSGYVAGTGGDILVETDGGTMDGGAIYTITYQNNAGNFDWSKVNVDQTPDGAPLSGGSINSSTVTQGGDGVDEVQTIFFTGTVTSGYFKLKVSRGGGDFQTTADSAYNATAAQVQAALEALDFFNSATATTTVCSVTSATQFTFETVTAGTGGALTAQGGDVGFMRQGPTLTAATGGGLVSGKYYYAYTFYNGVAESNFSAHVPIDVSTGDKVTLSNVLRGPEGTTERRIYRTDVNGRQMYEVGRITDNTTTTFDDTAKLPQGADPNALPGDAVTDAETPAADADRQANQKRASRRSIREQQAKAKAAAEKQREKLATNLGLLADWTDHDPPPVGIKHVGVVGETCFGINGSDVIFSQPGNVEHFPLANRVTPGRNVSETTRAWVPFDREIIIYTDVALYRLTQVGLSFEESRFEEIESPVGCAGEWCVAALDGQQGHVFLAKTGLYLFDGARVNEISYPIEPMFTDSSHEDYIRPEHMSQAIMEMSRDRMYLSYRTTSGAGNNDRLLECDFQDMADPKFTVLDYALTSIWRERTTNTLMGGDSDGKIWVLDYGWSDGSAGDHDWEVTTKEFPLNGGKSFRVDEVVLDANFAGISTTVVVTTRVRGSTKTATFTNTTTGRQRIVMKCPIYMKGETVQVAITSSSDTKRSLYAVGFTFLPIGIPEDEP